MSCQHEVGDEIYYELQPLSQNQEIIHCPKCGDVEKPGFYEDKHNLLWKIEEILHHLHNDGYIHISNGTEGEIISRQVANKCLENNCHDQGSILHFIFTNTNLTRFMDFKTKEAAG